MWLIGIIGFFVFGTTASLCRRYLGEKVPGSNHHVNLVFYLFFLLPAAILLWFFLPHSTVPSVNTIMLLVATSLIWPVYFLLSYRASHDIDASVYSMMLDSSTVITVLTAYVVLQERLQPYQLVGIVALIASGIVAVWPDLRKRSRSNRLGIIAALASVALLGFGIVVDKLALNASELGTYFLYSWGIQTIFIVLISYKYLKSFPAFLKHSPQMRLVYLYGGSGVLRSLSFSMAIFLAASPSLVNAASAFVTTTILLAAYWVLRERDNMSYKIAGAVLGLAGLLIVAI